MNPRTAQGIAAVKQGDRAAARRLLAAAVQENAGDITAWLWLAAALERTPEQIACLQQVLKLDPANQAAQRGLAYIQAVKPPLKPQPPPAEGPPAGLEPDQAAVSPDLSITDIPPDLTPPSLESAAPAAVFNTRPSQILSIVFFGLFLAGAVLVSVLLGQVPGLNEPLIFWPAGPGLNVLIALVLGGLLEWVVLYMAIRNSAARYELTPQQLTIRFRGRRIRLDPSDLRSVELHQTTMQKLFRIGTLELEAQVNGQLANVRLRDIPHPQRRLKALQALIP